MLPDGLRPIPKLATAQKVDGPAEGHRYNAPHSRKSPFLWEAGVSTERITGLLVALSRGQSDALDALLPIVYEELRSIAARQLRGSNRDRTLDTTGLVHEAYMRLADQTHPAWKDRRHFFSVAAIAMRQIVVDEARRRRAAKRGGGVRPLPLDGVELPIEAQAEEILAIDRALEDLAGVSPRLARVVELRYFAGLSVEETAGQLGVDPRTVKRDWQKARAFLMRVLGEGPGEP